MTDAVLHQIADCPRDKPRVTFNRCAFRIRGDVKLGRIPLPYARVQQIRGIAVEAAEMIYVGAGRGEEKKQYVIDFLNSKGFTLNTAEIENLIEAAVLELKLTQKEEASV